MRANLYLKQTNKQKKKKHRRGRLVKHSPKILTSEEKATTTTTTTTTTNAVSRHFPAVAERFRSGVILFSARASELKDINQKQTSVAKTETEQS